MLAVYVPNLTLPAPLGVSDKSMSVSVEDLPRPRSGLLMEL